MKKLLVFSFFLVFYISLFAQNTSIEDPRVFNNNKLYGFNYDTAKHQRILDTHQKDSVWSSYTSYRGINLNYGDNDIWSGGFRYIIKDIVYDISLGSTFNGYESNATYIDGQTKNEILVYKIGIGKKITEDFIIGIDYQHTQFRSKTCTGNIYNETVYEKNNFGLFCTYYFDNFGINFTTNSLTGNSIGISVRSNTF